MSELELEAGQSEGHEEPELLDHSAASEPQQCISPGDESTPTKLYEKCKQQALSYIRSYYFIELLLCLGFYFWLRFDLPWFDFVNERDLPFTTLDDGSQLKDFRFTETTSHSLLGDIRKTWYGLRIPVAIQVFMVLLRRKRYIDIHATVCAHSFALALTAATTDLIKSYVGYFRPNFFEVCEFNGEYCEDESDNPRRSFPSGHSSSAFCELTLLTSYIYNKYGRPRRINNFRRRFISVLSLLPMGLATAVAASRVADNKHFPADVTAGALLGASVATFCYNIWFWSEDETATT